jgi:hypothetical protein
VTRAIIAAVGALGLVFVWRAAALYQENDPFAYRLVLLIGVGLIAGLIELLSRATRIASLSRALATLPAAPAKADIDKSPAALRSLVEARLNGTPQSLGSAVFTSYLLGLLVMLGLLGTFMGLFETLSGAREALTTSGDVTALRQGLAAPMNGLSRAFGTSATGVACSAMLGLAAVFLRRAEARFVSSLSALTAGPLFPLTIAGRQLAALEAIAADREALPVAAKAIEKASKRLAAVATEIERAQRESSKEAADALREVASATERAQRESSKEAADTLREAAREIERAQRASSKETTDALRDAASSIKQDVQAGVTAAAAAIAPLLDRAVIAAGEGAE